MPRRLQLWRALMGSVWLLGTTPAWAIDADIAFHAQTRRVNLAPLCQGLLAQADALQAEQNYQKALCWLYGIAGPQRRPQALDLLRAVAPDMVEAQIALADSLQEGDATQQQEALQCYALAAATGDVRAIARRNRLLQRQEAAQIAAKAAAAKASDSPRQGEVADPLFDTLEGAESRLPGYHCHYYGLTRKECHAAMD